MYKLSNTPTMQKIGFERPALRQHYCCRVQYQHCFDKIVERLRGISCHTGQYHQFSLFKIQTPHYPASRTTLFTLWSSHFHVAGSSESGRREHDPGGYKSTRKFSCLQKQQSIHAGYHRYIKVTSLVLFPLAIS